VGGGIWGDAQEGIRFCAVRHAEPAYRRRPRRIGRQRALSGCGPHTHLILEDEQRVDDVYQVVAVHVAIAGDGWVGAEVVAIVRGGAGGIYSQA
jgi:hypothetical protein